MRSRHLIRRGNRYSFVCRIPSDLSPLFPQPTIWKSLKTDNEKDARLLASAEEYRAQQLFINLRTGMLSRDLENRIIAAYLLKGAERIEALATGTTFEPGEDILSPIDSILDTDAQSDQKARILFENLMLEDFSQEQSNEIFKKLLQEDTELLREQLIAKKGEHAEEYLEKISVNLKGEGIKLTLADKNRLGLKLVEAAIQLNEAELACIDGHWNDLRKVRESARNELALPYVDLKTALGKYGEWYLSSKPDVKPGTKDDMAVECRVLFEICGNVSINDFNSMAMVTKVKLILQKYPKNKEQRFKRRSIHTILKNDTGYDVISRTTANEYLKRAKAVIEYAGKEKWITSTNVWNGELFPTQKAAEEQRLPYDTNEITLLIDAICTQNLWNQKPPKPERFWIILIALFHGLRLGNIVALTKADICQQEGGMWVFMLREGKTKATVRPVPICDSLLLLGFVEWAEGLSRKKLFQDSSDSFSKWYNRDEIRGKVEVLGFESRYVTRDKKKCLYSLRHTFAGSVYGVTDDIKVTADMMGHSTGQNVTTRYTGKTKAEKLKNISEMLKMEGIDLDRLEERAKELYFTGNLPEKQ